MKKHALHLLVGSATALAASFVQAEPTRLFSQETAEVSKEVSVDLDYLGSNGLAGGLRIGAFGGEVLVYCFEGGATPLEARVVDAVGQI